MSSSKIRSVELKGVALAPGIGVGVAYRLLPGGPSFYRLAIPPEAAIEELARFRSARDAALRQLAAVRERLRVRLGQEQSYIIDAQQLILQDRQFVDGIEERITEQFRSPERAVREMVEHWEELYQSLDDPFFQQRASDLEDVGERVIANLLELEPAPGAAPLRQVILVGASVSLSALAEFQPGQLVGLVTVRGGEASHLTIAARAAGIPLVAAVDQLDQIRTGDPLIVDGFEGFVYPRPGARRLRSYQKRLADRPSTPRAVTDATRPLVTQDGERVHLMVNGESCDEVAQALAAGAEGVGLYRTETLFMKRKDAPVPEAEQYRAYRQLARELGDRPAYVRTLDIGDEGHPYFVGLAGEAEPVLGLRGIRLSLRHPEIFETQLRALLRASHHGALGIAFPMISSGEELVEARNRAKKVYETLVRQKQAPDELPPMGAVLEVPAAIYSLDAIVAHSDFLLVGTNDLIQYTLAVSRSNQQLADLYNPLHPAILASLQKIAQVAAREGVKTIVCGEMSAVPQLSALMIGMGFRYFSMSRVALMKQRRWISRLDSQWARRLATQALRLDSASRIEEFVRREFSLQPDLQPNGRQLLLEGSN